MTEVTFTRSNVRQALNMLSDWFPEEAEAISEHKKELIDLIVNGEDPRRNSQLGKMVYHRAPVNPASRKAEEPLFTPCESAIGGAVVSAGIFVVGVIGLKVTHSANLERAMMRSMGAKTLNGFQTMFKEFANSQDKFQAAKRLFGIAQSIWQGGGFKIIFEAWKKEARWYEFILAGVTLIAQLAIWFASDGIAFIAEVALIILSAVSLISSIYTAVTTCAGTKPPPYVAFSFLPLGSYVKSSSGMRVTLTAQCLDYQRKYKEASLELTDLPTNIYVENINGKLVVTGEDALVAQKFKPLGNYVNTSKSVKVTLQALCQYKDSGGRVKSEIDITGFSTSQKIANINGVLKKE